MPPHAPTPTNNPSPKTSPPLPLPSPPSPAPIPNYPPPPKPSPPSPPLPLPSPKVWDTRSHQLMHHYPAHSAAVTSLAVHPSGDYLLSTSRDATIKVRGGLLA